MKPGHSLRMLAFLLPVSLLLLSCGIVSQSARPTNTSEAPVDTFDLSQAGLPPDFPIYPGTHAYTGIPGLLIEYTVDVDVRTASEFYDTGMTALGWTGFSTGGESMGECGGDCGTVPTHTPGPTPTNTPPGWMHENMQMWTSGSNQIVINFSANANGTTDITITITSQ